MNQSTKLGKEFTRYVSDKGLASRLYKELQPLNIKKTNNPIKLGHGTKLRVLKGEIHMTEK